MALEGGASAPSSKGNLSGEAATANAAYPRVLIVNNRPLNRDFATGITLMNLFADWPKDRIAQVFADDLSFDEELCARSWQMRYEDRPVVRLLGPVIRRYRGTSARTEFTPSSTCRGASPNMSIVGSRRAPKQLTSFAARLINLLPYAVSRDFRRWVLNFGPEVIYSVLEDPDVTRLVRNLGTRLNIPIVPHFMDDWLLPSTSEPGKASMRRRRLSRDAEWLIRHSSARLVIGESMAKEYEERYGLRFLAFMNCVDLGRRSAYIARTGNSQRFRIAHVGSLHHNRGAVLMDVARALEQLRDEGLYGEIVVYDEQLRAENFGQLPLPPTVRAASLEEEMALETPDALVDAFLHVDSFDTTDMDYLRYSVSAKVPWCMAAGVPFVAYGPRGVGTIEYLRKSGASVVVDRRDGASLILELRKLLRDSARQAQLGEAGRLFTEENHDATVVGEGFRRVLADASGRRSDWCGHSWT